MRSLAVLVTVVAVMGWADAGNTAEAQEFGDTSGAQALTSSTVFFGGERVWRAKRPGERVITPVLRSHKRGAIAFATRSRRGNVTLVVVLVAKAVRGHVMTWRIPRRTRRRGRASVMWLGQRKVGFGYSAVRPVVVASWRVRR